MKTYSVKDIADMLNTNPETVRRWIRSGKLKADQNSRKDGNMVREEDLYKYLSSTAKYAAFAAGLVASNPVLSLTAAMGASVIGEIVAVLTSKSAKKGGEIRILTDEIKHMLRKEIKKSEKKIERKKAAIAGLQEEINMEQLMIREYETALEHLQDAMSVVKRNDPEEVID